MKKFIFVLLAFALTSCSSLSSKSGDGSGDGYISDEDLALHQREFGEGNIPVAAEDGIFADIHFGYDSFAVSPEDAARVSRDAKVLLNDPTLRVEVEGHCDKRGTSEYNLVLGEARAKAVADILITAGVANSQVSTISYGEEIPLDPAEDDGAYAKNRRVHFAVFRKNS